jgi:hypothetical protein
VAEAVSGAVDVDIAFVAKLGLLADPKLTPPRPVYLTGASVKESEEAQTQPRAP